MNIFDFFQTKLWFRNTDWPVDIEGLGIDSLIQIIEQFLASQWGWKNSYVHLGGSSCSNKLCSVGWGDSLQACISPHLI